MRLFFVFAYFLMSLTHAQTIKLDELIEAKESLEELILRAEAGETKAQLKLGIRYRDGKDAEQNSLAAITWLERASQQGSAQAMFSLGNVYYFGLQGVQDSRSKALSWYEKAAKVGHAEAAFKRAKLGQSIEAFNWFLIAANSGHAAAQYEAGMAYYLGIYVPKNYSEAARWLKASAQQQYPEANFSLGILYRFGKGVPQNYREAYSLFQTAAKFGHKEATLQIGLATQSGRGIPQDNFAALTIIRTLAKTGYFEAIVELANCYEKGLGVEKWPFVAHSIYNYLATKHPHYQQVIDKRLALTNSLSSADINKSQDLTNSMLKVENVVDVLDTVHLNSPAPIKRRLL